MKCQFCNKIFTRKYNLLAHQRGAKYCLKLQGVNLDKLECDFCDRSFSNKTICKRHMDKCSSREKVLEYVKKIEKYKKMIHRKNEMIRKLRIKKAKFKKMKEEVERLKELATRREGNIEAYNKFLDKPRIINNIHPKLVNLSIKTIQPFTMKTIRYNIQDKKSY